MYDMENRKKKYSITVNAKSASLPDEVFHWEGESKENDTLEELLDYLSFNFEFFKNGIYDSKLKRMFPYHLITINETLILPDEIKDFRISKDLNINIKPFISGG